MQTLTSEDGKELTFGASLKLSGFDTTLKNIVTNGEFKTYTFLLKATEDGDQGLTLTVSVQHLKLLEQQSLTIWL